MESIPNQNHIAENRPPTAEEIEKMRRQNYLQNLKENPANIPENKNNVVKLETESAKYSIAYSLHNRQNNPEDMVGSNGIILELPTTPDFIDKEIDMQLQQQQYMEVIRYAVQHNIPLFFNDINGNTADQKNTWTEGALKDVGIPMIYALIGGALVKSSIKESISKPITRRSFLKNLGKVAAAAYLATPAIETAALLSSTDLSKHEPDEGDTSRKIYRKLDSTNNLIHPELNTVTIEIRNELIAEKSEKLAELLRQTSGQKQNLSLIIGAAHTGIERSLKDTRENRLDKIRGSLNYDQIKENETVVRVDWDYSTTPPTPKISQIKIEL